MQGNQLSVYPSTDDREESTYLGQNTFPVSDSTDTALCTFTDESRFTLESDSGHLLSWKKRSTRYHQSNIVERHSY
ncbi:hypothetical protein TNCV_1030981 [Trichonephila clavipes]|nr:hypothetical protein TNCV_1030981 [Trichonephila clavipes]